MERTVLASDGHGGLVQGHRDGADRGVGLLVAGAPAGEGDSGVGLGGLVLCWFGWKVSMGQEGWSDLRTGPDGTHLDLL